MTTTKTAAQAASLASQYTKAMIAGNTGICIRIEQAHDLYGYPPEVVCIGLCAIDDGRDPGKAVDAYINGEDSP